jgi:hypothetical protein
MSDPVRSRIFLCSPVPFADLKLSGHTTNGFQLGLVESIEIPYEGPKVVTITRRKFMGLLEGAFPITRLAQGTLRDLGLPDGSPFNLYYQRDGGGGLYVMKCDPGRMSWALLVNLNGEFEVAKFPFGSLQEV